MGEIGERLFVSRNTVSSQVTSIYRKLGVSSRNDAVDASDNDRPARRVARTLTGLGFQGLTGVVPERQRELRGRRDNGGEPDDGNDADQHVDDLGGRRARIDRGIGVRP